NALFSQIGVTAPDSRIDAAREQSEYEQALSRILRSVRASDRRQGLLNLFWLAHSKDVADYLHELEAKQPAVRKAKYSLHPILSSTYRRLDLEGRREKNGPLLGSENPGLIESIIDDGFAFTETSSSELDFTSFLKDNKRYRLPAEVFFEIQQVLVRETERRLREGDRGLLSRAARHLPGLPRDQYLKPQSLIKIMMNAHVLPYLLGDPWSTGSRLLASPTIKAEAERRKPAEIVDAFLDVITGAKRFEIVSQVRDRVELIGAFGRELDLEDKASRNQRIYEFGEAAQVLNSAVSATVLFLDLRGFTQTSEGQISERDLTRELYAVFDEFVPLVRRFGGTVDKYLGDGMMVTFGTDRADPLDALNAVRTAILCQDSLRQKRKEGKTYFQMGIAIHFGRVYLARFIEDEENVQSTVIGRNVNLAGRLSSAAKKPLEEDETATPPPPRPTHASGMRVFVDGSGTLFNEGIAISRDTLVQLESHLALIHGEGVMEYEDETIDKRILIRYAGDAKFKGVRSSLPVYEVDYEGRS
ncbi:MAG TPA: adenylate/guanylate cyclase domain-containing protein, partial [Vicinamibacteria bacterium]